jgi:hypothetical protein
MIMSAVGSFDSQLQIEDTKEYEDFLDSQDAQQHQIDGDNALTDIVADINFVMNKIKDFQDKHGYTEKMQSSIASLGVIKKKISDA